MSEDQEAFDAFVQEWAETMKRELVYTGHLSDDTLTFWNAAGYTEDENAPTRPYIEAIELGLSIPQTGLLSKLADNYRRTHYTRDCLDPSLHHSIPYCFIEAVKADDATIVPEILSVNPITVNIGHGLIEAAKTGNMEIIGMLIPDAERRTIEISDDIYTQAITEAARYGHVEAFLYIYHHVVDDLERIWWKNENQTSIDQWIRDLYFVF